MLREAARLTPLVIALVLLTAPDAGSEVLRWEEVQALDWTGPIEMGLKQATDGVFDEGPDYWYENEDEWFNESDVIIDRPNFTISVYNNRKEAVEELVFLLAYKDGTFSGISVGGWVTTPTDFYDNQGYPFGPAGNRPGNGEAALFNGAEGVVFVSVGMRVPAKDTVEVPIVVMQAEGVLLVHFDVYGLRAGRNVPQGPIPSSAWDRGLTTLADARVVSSCANSHDVTWDTVCFPSATLRKTWSNLKTLFEF